MHHPTRTSPNQPASQPASRILSFIPASPLVVALFFIVSIAVAPAAHALDRNREIGNSKAKRNSQSSLSPQFFAAQSQVPTSSNLLYPDSVAVDAVGDVYISDTGHNRALKETLLPGGAYSETVIGSGMSNPYGIAVDSSQNVYITDNGNNRVLKETLNNGTYDQSVVATSTLSYPTGIAVDANGALYICDTSNERILKETPSGSSYTETVVGSGFDQIVSIAVDSSGDVFVSDVDTWEIYEETYSAGSYTESTVPTSGLSYPWAVTVDSNGNLYISDFANSRIVELTNDDGSYTQSVYPVATIAGILGLAVDAQGDLYLADSYGQSIKEEALNGGNFGPAALATSAGPIYAIFQFSGGSGSDTLTLGGIVIPTLGINTPEFADAGSTTCSTTASYQAGDTCYVSVNFAPEYAGAQYGAAELLDGSSNPLASAHLYGIGLGPQVGFSPPQVFPIITGVNQPFGLAFDGRGDLFEADYGSGNVQVYYFEDEWVYGGSIATVTDVAGMAIDGAGNIFFSGYSNGNVYETFAASDYTNTIIVSSAFTHPFGVAVDGSGNLFVADRANAVKEIPYSGGVYGAPVAIGSGFSNPYGIALDSYGNVYVADAGNNAVKEILQAGGYTTVNTLATIPGVESIVVDANGNVYTASAGSTNTVSKIMAVNGVIPDDPTTNTLIADPNGPEIVTLDPYGDVYYGTGGGSSIFLLDYAFSPPSLNFATTTVGSTSSDSPQTVTIENLGNQPLVFPVPSSGTNASVSANFTLGSTTTCPVITPSGSQVTLAANASCVYAINFVPASAGSISGSVTMTNNAQNQSSATQAIQLSGTANPAAAPAVGFAPTTLAFGNQTLGVASTALPVVLTNTGTANLTLGVISVTGTNSSDFVPSPDCPSTLAPSAHCTVNVTFTPSVLGAETASLQVTDNAAGSPQSVSLTGTGVNVAASYSITANPAALTIAQGQSGSTTLTVTPVGGMTGTLTFSCTGLPAHTDCVFAPGQVVMSGNDTPATVTLTVNTAGSNGVIAQAQPSPIHTQGWSFRASLRSIALLILPVGLVLCFMSGFIPGQTTKNRRQSLGVLLWVRALWIGALLIGASTTIGMTACGGYSRSDATPVGQYSIHAVAAIGGVNGQSAVVTITITR